MQLQSILDQKSMCEMKLCVSHSGLITLNPQSTLEPISDTDSTYSPSCDFSTSSFEQDDDFAQNLISDEAQSEELFDESAHSSRSSSSEKILTNGLDSMKSSPFREDVLDSSII